jgi:hypothetical protein
MKRHHVGIRGVRRMGRDGDCAPFCVKCHNRMRLNGNSKTRQSFRCSICEIYISTRFEPSVHTPLGETRPYCVMCRVAMSKRGKNDSGIQIFSCLTCKVKVVSRRSRSKPNLLPPPRSRRNPPPDSSPCCIKCHVQMSTRGQFSSGAIGYCCWRCGSAARSFYVYPWRDVRTSRAHPSDHIPYCATCRVKMYRAFITTATERNRRYKCPKCKVSVSGHHRGVLTRRGTYSNGEALLAFIGSQIPGHIAGELRTEATQSIACDLLLRKIRPQDLSRRQVNAYIRKSYGMCDDRFRFVSLEKPLPSGDRFGDLLEG